MDITANTHALFHRDRLRNTPLKAIYIHAQLAASTVL